MGFAYLSRWRFVVFLKNKAIPHRLDVGFAPSFSPIKGGSPSIINHTSPLPLKAICSITQLFWVFTFLSQFLRKLICGLKFVFSLSSVGVVR